MCTIKPFISGILLHCGSVFLELEFPRSVNHSIAKTGLFVSGFFTPYLHYLMPIRQTF